MERFLIRTAVFTFGVVAVIFVLFLCEDGYSDPFYLKFTTPKQTSLIIGTSRASQGIMPSILNNGLGAYFELPILNYCFTLNNSSFGKVYLESIRNKLALDGNNGLFIVTVDPWSVSAIAHDPNDETLFPENDNFLAKMDNVSSNPNFDFLFDFYPNPYYEIIYRRIKKGPLKLHEDGWLEVSVEMDSSTVQRRTARKMKEYELNASRYKFSSCRFGYLEKTISELKKRGTVYMVRLPVHQRMLEIEEAFMNDFNVKILSLARGQGVPYLDMTDFDVRCHFTDGNHLHKSSSNIVTKEIANWILATKMSSCDSRLF
jgi:hypothetical protein